MTTVSLITSALIPSASLVCQ
ncbi:unnamed protein product, partial [Rotaria magnacalcarata]